MQEHFRTSLQVEDRDASQYESDPDLERRLQRIFREAQLAWPTLKVLPDTFATYLGERMATEDNIDMLDSLHISDLYLACACCSDQQAGIEAFERHCAGECEKGLARLGLPASEVDEIKQSLRDRLFVASATDGERIRRYSGKGPIRAWYRITALRAAIDRMRVNDRLQTVTEITDLDERAPLVDPELEFLKKKYRQHFKNCFQDALRDLSNEQRNLLRYQLLDGLTLEQIGLLYGVHLSSIARRLQKTRAALLDCTRRHLQHQLDIDEGELDSIMRLIHSRLDVSISQVLRRSD